MAKRLSSESLTLFLLKRIKFFYWPKKKKKKKLATTMALTAAVCQKHRLAGRPAREIHNNAVATPSITNTSRKHYNLFCDTNPIYHKKKMLRFLNAASQHLRWPQLLGFFVSFSPEYGQPLQFGQVSGRHAHTHYLGERNCVFDGDGGSYAASNRWRLIATSMKMKCCGGSAGGGDGRWSVRPSVCGTGFWDCVCCVFCCFANFFGR